VLRFSPDGQAGRRALSRGGIFASGSAAEIAEAVIAAAREEGSEDAVERRAMAKLAFYENRAGRNLSDERRATLEEAKQLVRDELGYKANDLERCHA
jgi:Protein of unknown function (DUF3175)